MTLRVSQKWFLQTERLASEPFERKVLAVGAAHRQHLPLPVNAFGASSQSVQRRLRNPDMTLKFSWCDEQPNSTY
ncbi:MAG TPA: hypothetical protein VFB60_24170 [Ktedonobacteraceae bacterium]|nr:hypothetical protein [Ktedonobacteraceae bacterium]